MITPAPDNLPARAASGAPSAYFGWRALRTLERIGDLMLPGDGGLPSFSATGCLGYVDDLLAYMTPGDRASLRLLLQVLSVFPDGGLRAFLRLLGLSARLPAALGAPLRLIELGLKGLIMNLYYSNKTGPEYTGVRPFDVLGFDLTRIRDHRPA